MKWEIYFSKFLIQNLKQLSIFLSNKSSIFEDLEIILKMPKWKFLKELI